MSVSLYRKGNSHVIRGVECEMVTIEIRSMKSYLADGWLTNPLHINENPTFSEVDNNESGKLSSKEVRLAAKKAGISEYKTARISTLKKKLGYE